MDDADFLSRLMATFAVEAAEYLASMQQMLAELEGELTESRQQAVIEALYREAHSLKGAARSVNYLDIELICQALESELAVLKQGAALDARRLEVLFAMMDQLTALQAAAAQPAGPDAGGTASADVPLRDAGMDPVPTAPELPAGEAVSGGEIAAAGGAATSGGNTAASRAGDDAGNVAATPPLSLHSLSDDAVMERPMEGSGPFPSGKEETVRVSVDKLEAVLQQVEELFTLKETSHRLAAHLHQLREECLAWRREQADAAVRGWRATRQPPADRQPPGPVAPHPAGPGMEAAPFSRRLASELDALGRQVERDGRTFNRMVNQLLADAKDLMMQPMASLLAGFTRSVRDLAKAQGKQVAYRVHGEALKVDRRLLEALKDPLMHLIRNSIDHGIESPAERQRKGKQPRGRLDISVTALGGGRIELLLRDDGAGLQTERILAAAQRAGIAPEGLAGHAQDLNQLIFESGVTTRDIPTEVSGRGLGMAIVREKIEKIGGQIMILPSDGQAGTAFRLELPVRLALFQGLLVRLRQHWCLLPIMNIVHSVRVAPEQINVTENRQVFSYGGHSIPLVPVASLLGLPAAHVAATRQAAVIYQAGKERVAFAVDEILSEQEVLLQNLGYPLSRVRYVAGAAILPNGKVVTVLHMDDLMQAAGAHRMAAPAEMERPSSKRVLIAEDTLTTRILLKHVLEAAGYTVHTAADGAEAMDLLQRMPFDLLVSDVEMPVLDGFALTEQIRAHPQLEALPVVLVTALESAEHFQRGMEVGANAYITKSGFDQGKLLEVLERLI